MLAYVDIQCLKSPWCVLIIYHLLLHVCGTCCDQSSPRPLVPKCALIFCGAPGSSSIVAGSGAMEGGRASARALQVPSMATLPTRAERLCTSHRVALQPTRAASTTVNRQQEASPPFGEMVSLCCRRFCFSNSSDFLACRGCS